MKKSGFSLSKEMELFVPAEPGACSTYAKDELIRLLAKLGTKTIVSGSVKGLAFSLVPLS